MRHKCLYFKRNNFENLKKLQSIVNIFVFFIKISRQNKESPPFLNNHSFSTRNPPFLKRVFQPHPYCQIRGSQSPLCQGGGFELCRIPYISSIILFDKANIDLLYRLNYEAFDRMFTWFTSSRKRKSKQKEKRKRL